MTIRLIFSLLATIIAVASYIPYIRDIRRGTTKPHGFSWLIWALLAYVAGFAQLSGGGGVATIVTFVTATIALYISFISIRGHVVKITSGDWIILVVSLAAIPLWVITKRPLLSVILVSLIDVVGFWPTFRKSFHAPHQETLSTHLLSTLKHCLTIAALQRYNLVTVLYPASLAITTAAFVVMLVIRRPQVGLPPQAPASH